MLDTKRQFAILREKFEAEKREAQKKPLDAEQTAEAAALLQEKFGGKLF